MGQTDWKYTRVALGSRQDKAALKESFARLRVGTKGRYLRPMHCARLATSCMAATRANGTMQTSLRSIKHARDRIGCSYFRIAI
jgi:hypothetical protein